jgi:hypothetical protein
LHFGNASLADALRGIPLSDQIVFMHRNCAP